MESCKRCGESGPDHADVNDCIAYLKKGKESAETTGHENVRNWIKAYGELNKRAAAVLAAGSEVAKGAEFDGNLPAFRAAESEYKALIEQESWRLIPEVPHG